MRYAPGLFARLSSGQRPPGRLIRSILHGGLALALVTVFGAGILARPASTGQAAPNSIPATRYTLVGDPSFTPDRLSPEMRYWYDRLWTALTNGRLYPDADQAAASGDLYFMGRTLNSHITALLTAFRVTKDLRFLDEVDRLMEIARRELWDSNGDGYINWRWLYDPSYSGYGNDRHKMDEMLTHSLVATVAYALKANAHLDARYSQHADFWISYMLNHFFPKWEERGGIDKSLTHPYTSFMRMHYYMYKITGDTAHLNEANRRAGVLDSMMVERGTANGVAFTWDHRVPNMGDPLLGCQPTVYGMLTVMQFQDLALEGYGNYANDDYMRHYAATFRDLVVRFGMTQLAGNVCGDQSERFSKYMISSIPGLAYWDPTGQIKSFAEQAYRANEQVDNPKQIYIPAYMLQALSATNPPEPPPDNPTDIPPTQVVATDVPPTNIPPTSTPLPPPPPGVGRVTQGLQVLYTFDEGAGSTVFDVSGVGKPLHLTIANPGAVQWASGKLTVNDSTIIASGESATKIADAVRTTNEITVEAWIKPANTWQEGPARIITMSLDPYKRDFTLGQGNSNQQPASFYDMRLRTSTHTTNGKPSLTSQSGTLTTGLSHVVYTRSASGTARLYVNGTEVVRGTVDGNLSNWDAYRLALANEFNSDRPWRGDYHLVAIFNRALSPVEVNQNYVAGAESTQPQEPTAVPPTATAIPTDVPPTATLVPTDIPPTATSVPPTATAVPPTATDVPTEVPTDVPPTQTPLPTATLVPTDVPTDTPPTATDVPTEVPTRDAEDVPTEIPTSIPTNTPTDVPPTATAVPPTSTPLPTQVPPPNADRVTKGLQVLYTFQEGSGNVVHDTAGSGWPLDLKISDMSGVSWLRGGLSVTGPTIIASDGAGTKLSQAVRDSNELTLEAWIQPATLDQEGPARILTMSSDMYRRNFTLGQGGDRQLPADFYGVRLRTTTRTTNGKPDLVAPRGSLTTALSHVVYTRDAQGTARMYVDGVEQVQGVVDGTLTNWDWSFRLALANELSGGRLWKGDYYLVAIYSRALTPDEVKQNLQAGITRQVVSDPPQEPTPVPPTATDVPPTLTPTNVPPTATDVPPTATDVPPTDVPTDVPPTATDLPTLTPTNVPPTDVPTDIPPTATPLPPTATLDRTIHADLEPGLLGTYFDTADLTGEGQTRVDGQLAFEWGYNAPGMPVGPEFWSARWTGYLMPRFSEAYTFHTLSDDGVRLWVNDQLVIDNWTEHGVVEDSGQIALVAGQAASLRLDYFDTHAHATIKLLWSSASQPKEIIPASQLFHSTAGDTVEQGDPPPPTATLPPPTATSLPTAVPTIAVTATPTLAPTDAPAEPPVVPENVVPGLYGEYFVTVDLTGDAHTRIDSTLAFDWGYDAPGMPVGPEFWSARWTGYIVPRFSETYTFHTLSDDGVRLWVNGQLVIDDWTEHDAMENAGQIDLKAGQYVPVTVEYFDTHAHAVIQLSWSSANQPREIVPAGNLFHSQGAVGSDSRESEQDVVPPTPTAAPTQVPPTPIPPTSTPLPTQPPGVSSDTFDSSLQVVQTDQDAVSLTGAWTVYQSELASGGRYLFSSGSSDDTMSLAFEGTRIQVSFVQHPALGTFAIEIDGVQAQTVVSTADQSMFGSIVTVDNLPSGTHTLRIVPVTGTIAIDALAVPVLVVINAPPAAAPADAPANAAPDAAAAVSDPTEVPPTTVPPTRAPTSTPPPLGLPFMDGFDGGTGWVADGAWRADAQTAFSGTSWFADSSQRGQVSVLRYGGVLNLGAAQNPHVSFWQRATLSAGDVVTVEVSVDSGQSWGVVERQVGLMTDWFEHSINLSAYQGQVIGLRFRLDTTGALPDGAATTGYWLDQLIVEDMPLPPTATPPPAATSTPVPQQPTQVPPTATPVPGPWSEVGSDESSVSPTPTDVPTDLPPDAPAEDDAAPDDLSDEGDSPWTEVTETAEGE